MAITKPTTGERQVDKTQEGYDFLKKVGQAELREWKDIKKLPVYAFLVKHRLDQEALIGRELLNPPKGKMFTVETLKFSQGYAQGMRFFEAFFDAVEREWDRRISGGAYQSPPGE